MEVKYNISADKGHISLNEQGIEIAIINLIFKDDKLFIDSTNVMPGNEGKGLGKLLVKTAVDFARKNSLKILPICPYAKSVLAKTDEYNDVLI